MKKTVKMGNIKYDCETKKVKGRWTGKRRKKDGKIVGKSTRMFCKRIE